MGTDPTGLSPTTKMLVPLFVLLASSFIAVESAIAFGTCPRSDWGKETTEEKWECRNGESSCFSSTDTCSHDGSQQIVEGTAHYDADGSFREAGGGWDCRDKCRGCRFSCSGSQSRTSFESGPSSGFGFGSSSGSSGSRPSGVESAIAFGTCPRRDWGKETTEENWECTNGKSSCSSTTDSCSNDGELRSTAGTNNYDANGNLLPSTGGWDCRDKCRGCRFSCSGSQSRTSFGSRPSSGFGSSSGFGFGSSSGSSGSRPSGGSRNCDYRCTSGGGCEVSFGGTLGSCFPRDFGGSCSGTPRECQDCNQAINC